MIYRFVLIKSSFGKTQNILERVFFFAWLFNLLPLMSSLKSKLYEVRHGVNSIMGLWMRPQISAKYLVPPHSPSHRHTNTRALLQEPHGFLFRYLFHIHWVYICKKHNK